MLLIFAANTISDSITTHSMRKRSDFTPTPHWNFPIRKTKNLPSCLIRFWLKVQTNDPSKKLPYEPTDSRAFLKFTRISIALISEYRQIHLSFAIILIPSKSSILTGLVLNGFLAAALPQHPRCSTD